MNPVSRFIAEAKAKGLHDEQIKELLKSSGWSEEQAQLAILGLTVPRPTLKTSKIGRAAVGLKPTGDSIGALEAALHHILLWVFTLTSSIMISVVSYALVGDSDASSTTLITYIVLELMTFAPFVILFTYYLIKLRSRPTLKTGRVWSIITIVVHSLGLLGALIAFILALALARGDAQKAILVASTTLACLFALIIATYVIANFMQLHRLRKADLLSTIPILLFAIIAFSGVGALTQLGSLRADEKTRDQLYDVVIAVRKEIAMKDAIPATIKTLDADTHGIEYSKQSDTMYELCAQFHRNRSTDLGGQSIIEDDYVSSYYFENVNRGKQCFTIESTKLTEGTYYEGQ